MSRDRHHALATVALLVVLAACLVTAGYSGATGIPTDDADRVAEPLAGTAWHLVTFRADNGSVVAPMPGSEPSIIFGESGTLSGSAGCNLYSASYRINGSALSVEPPATGTVAAAEPGLVQQEARFRELLAAAASYRVEEDRLVIAGLSGEDLLVFTRAAQPESVPLLATEWHLTHYSTGSGNAVASPVPGTGITLTLDPDGTLSGSAGCNAYSAPYRLNETGIAVERIIVTKASATEPAGIMEQEGAYLDLLRSAAGYRIVGDTLAVIDGKGRAILFFETGRQ